MIQHYVPKIYLEKFGIKKPKGVFVDVYDKEKEKHFNTNIKNICSIKDFYTLSEDNVISDKLLIEKLYAQQIEPLYTKTYDILTNDNIFHLTSSERIDMLKSVLQLLMRNPKVIHDSLIMHESKINKLYDIAIESNKKGITYLEEDFSFRDYSKQEILEFIKEKVTNIFKEKHIQISEKIINYHLKSKIIVKKITDPSFFITSDNPITIQDYFANEKQPLAKSKEFTITLNEKYALTVLHDETKELNRIYRIDEGSPLINSTIINQSNRFILGSRNSIETSLRVHELLESNSIEKKMDLIGQIIDKFSDKSKELGILDTMLKYHHIYKSNGELTVEEQNDLFKSIHKMAISQKRITLPKD